MRPNVPNTHLDPIKEPLSVPGTLRKVPPFLIDEIQLKETIREASQALLSLQHPDGYWWFTLEANESINAGFIQLMHFLDMVDIKTEQGLVRRILQEQHEDGSWGLYYMAPGDLSTTVECYLSLRLAGISKEDPALVKAKNFILRLGGLTKIRIFSRIHLALFGLVPWSICPVMPAELILLPPWAPVNIYHFSSWARASIVPLLVVLNKKPVVPLSFDLEELYEQPANQRKWAHSRQTNPLSIERLFLFADKGLKYMGKIPFRPWRDFALEKTIEWVWEHVQKTQDIYPAMAYAAMAFKAYGYSKDSPQIQTVLKGLKSFQEISKETNTVHQQCCISPGWDTPWALVALLKTGLFPDNHPQLLKAGQWLLTQEIRFPKGDWHIHNPKGKPGAWSFEFKNDYFPDVDDTIEVVAALSELDLPREEKNGAIERGLQWIRSMQNDDGGFGAFDRNNDLELVNKIPFADHGACLDPSTPDITGRVVELFLRLGTSPEDPLIQKAIRFLKKSQEKFGGWYGRWGVNYIYGTWCVLTGLAYLNQQKDQELKKQIHKACEWLKSIQNSDGGFSESPESYVTKTFHPYPESVPSQTAWALMALMAGGENQSVAVQRGVQYLLDRFQQGTWEEKYFTATGFPGHFYIRYHGYRYYFPLLALARYENSLKIKS